MTSTDVRPLSEPLPLERTPAADPYPLLLKHLLHAPLEGSSSAEIVYRDVARYDYPRFYERLTQLASALSRLGVGPGDTVGVLDWDSHRYLECFFAVPMMGAVLHTVNVRLSPEQIVYTINHAEDDIILVNGEFIPLLEQIWNRIEPGKTLVLLDDTDEATRTELPLA